ncbi:hypothetical protein [Thiocapsa sp.]|uniref:hypothetical protein n=1 Tax=Thiocapsa sp. TaxID=2024551 RepID=UPI003593F34D
MTAQSGQTRLGRGGRCVCTEIFAGVSVVRRVSATAVGRGDLRVLPVLDPVVEADAVPAVVDRGAALGLADAPRGAADVAPGSVGACASAGSGVSSVGS